LSLHRSRAALVASDHLPLVADFRISALVADAHGLEHHAYNAASLLTQPITNGDRHS
jgi:hypothetical protein